MTPIATVRGVLWVKQGRANFFPFVLRISCFYVNFTGFKTTSLKFCQQNGLIFIHEPIKFLYDTLMEVLVKVRAIIKMLENDGWYMDRTKGGGIDNLSILRRVDW